MPFDSQIAYIYNLSIISDHQITRQVPRTLNKVEYLLLLVILTLKMIDKPNLRPERCRLIAQIKRVSLQIKEKYISSESIDPN